MLNDEITAEQLTVVGFNKQPFKPLDVDLAGFDFADIDADAIDGKDMQVDLAIALYTIAKRNKTGRKTVRTGLRRLSRYHGTRLVESLNSVHIAQCRPLVQDEVVLKAKRDRVRAREIADEFDMQRRLQHISKRELGEGAWANFLDAVSSLAKFLNGFAEVRAWTGGIERPLVRDDARCALTEEQMFNLWYAASLMKDPELAHLFLDLMRETACRVQAAYRLNLEDIDWSTGFVTLRTKNRRTHRTCISTDLMQRIRQRAERMGWTGHVDHSYRADDFSALGFPAFQTESGSRIGSRWTEDFFNKVDRLIRDIERDKITAHWVRHTTITQVARMHSQEAASRWAGHRPSKSRVSSESTPTYMKWMDVERVALFNVLFPDTPTGPFTPGAEPSVAFRVG